MSKHSAVPPPRPQRGPAALSDLTGPDVKLALDKMGVSIEAFQAFSKAEPTRLQHQLSGGDTEKVPLAYEGFLFILLQHPEYRAGKKPMDLPFAEWGIDPDLPGPRLGASPKARISGPKVKIALAEMGVSHQQFCFLAGVHDGRFHRFINGSILEMPPLFWEAYLFIFANHPEYRTGNAMLDLPLKDWGIDVDPL